MKKLLSDLCTPRVLLKTNRRVRANVCSSDENKHTDENAK